MTPPGPSIAELTHWLSECPAEFQEEPRLGNAGRVHVAAVVSDLLAELGGARLTDGRAAAYAGNPSDRVARNRLRTILVAAWLLHHPWFRGKPALAAAAERFLSAGLDELAPLVDAGRWIADADRREELARAVLAALDVTPAGETRVAAGDRLTTLSTLQRSRVLRETRAAQERVQKIREAMQRKAAEEAAAKYTRE